jgi:hypothetical protein
LPIGNDVLGFRRRRISEAKGEKKIMTNRRNVLSTTRTQLLLGGIGVLLIGGMMGSLIVTSPAMAAGQQGSPTPPPTPGSYCQTYVQMLTHQLGVTQQQLAQANAAALKAVLQQAVANGQLTQAQANQFEQQISAHGDVCHELDRYGSALMQAHQAITSAVATKLGISANTLQSDLANGQDIVTLAAQHGVSRSELNSTILATVQTQLQDAVTGGLLNNQQAQQILSTITTQINRGNYIVVGLAKPTGSPSGP